MTSPNTKEYTGSAAPVRIADKQPIVISNHSGLFSFITSYMDLILLLVVISFGFCKT